MICSASTTRSSISSFQTITTCVTFQFGVVSRVASIGTPPISPVTGGTRVGARMTGIIFVVETGFIIITFEISCGLTSGSISTFCARIVTSNTFLVFFEESVLTGTVGFSIFYIVAAGVASETCSVTGFTGVFTILKASYNRSRFLIINTTSISIIIYFIIIIMLIF